MRAAIGALNKEGRERLHALRAGWRAFPRFGVTLAERGVSQLVSVELEQAERLLEAS
ncbi:hypothetical protein [Rhodoblastus sp.]|uniref:hypothetical protein n=1 Tax=Rhodoblastus sp. TaxID=1962975 RepID=UPI0025D48A8A|nr:hypothetical protein [Rhodoblastus sp.]